MRGQPLGEALVHRVRIGAGQVGATAALEEERVAGDELAVDHEALAPGRVAGRVHQRDRDPADVHDVATVVQREVGVGEAGAALHPLRLGALHVHGDRAVVGASSSRRPSMRVAHDVAAAVVGVVVRRQRTGEAEAVGVEHLASARRRRTRDRSPPPRRSLGRRRGRRSSPSAAPAGRRARSRVPRAAGGSRGGRARS